MKSNNNTTAVIYARFSSDMQREESIEAQIRACREYAARNRLEIIEEYIDRAKSATSDQRPEFQRMIREAANGGFSTIIVHKLDRFSRNRYDSAHYKHQLKRCGVTLRSVVENIDGSPESVIMESVLEGMAEYYSLNLAREIEKGKRENAYKGKHVGGKPPLGYDVDRETMMLVVNPIEAEAVKLIYSMYIDGCTYGQIIDVLNDRGFTTKWGEQFGKNSLHSILKNPKYTGTYTYSRSAPKNIDGKRNGHAYRDDSEIIKVEGALPALVSKEDFGRVQECMTHRKRQAARYHAKRSYLLSGKVFCGECGAVYVGNCRIMRSDHPEYISYRCNNRTKRPRCDGWEIRARTIESIVLGELSHLVFNDNMIPKLSDGYRRHLKEQNKTVLAIQDVLSKQITAIQKDMDSIMEVIIKTSSDALVSKLNDLDAQKQDLIQKLRKAQDDCKIEEPSSEQLSTTFSQAREMLKSGRLPTVKALIERYVHKVIVSGEHIEIQFNLNMSSRVVTYSAYPLEKETPQPTQAKVIEVFSFVPTKMLVSCGGRLQSKCEHLKSLILTMFSALVLVSAALSAASSSASVTVLLPSFQLNVMTNLSSYRNTEFTKISTKLRRYSGFSISPPLNLLIQKTICSFVSGVFSIFSRARAISRSAFFVSSSSSRCLTEAFAIPSSMELMIFPIRFSISSSCFCKNGMVVFSRF